VHIAGAPHWNGEFYGTHRDLGEQIMRWYATTTDKVLQAVAEAVSWTKVSAA